MTPAPRAFAAVLAIALLAGCSTTTTGNGSRSAGASSPSPVPSTSSAASSSPAGTTSSSKATASPSASVPTTALRTENVTSVDGSTQWSIKVWVQDDTVNCEDHAYGAQVIAYLKANLCRGMTRLLAATTVGGRPVGIAQTLISFSGDAPAVYQTAGNFATLVSQNGTGNVNDLLREGKRFPNSGSQVGDPDAFNADGQDAGVGIDDVWYLDGSTPANDPALLALAKSLFLQLN
jgi:hypothetical protein